MKTKAFTLIELLVVIAIIAALAAFAVPALTSALNRGQMTSTLNSARQLYLSGYQMALDGSTNSDANLAWPGDYASMSTLQDYCTKLVQNDYLKAGDLPKVLSAPGAVCTATADTSDPVNVTLGGKSGLKVYKVKEADAATTIFAVSANYIYNTALISANSPFGDKGFVVVHKGGDAVLLRKNNATLANYGGTGNELKFQSAVGKMTGDQDGTVTGESGKVLTNP